MKKHINELYGLSYFGATMEIGGRWFICFGYPKKNNFTFVNKGVAKLFEAVAKEWLQLDAEYELAELIDDERELKAEMNTLVNCLDVAVDFNDASYFYK